jgi:hypothetical protein
VQAGDTFLVKDHTLDDHLWIVLSDPINDAEHVLIVSLTTATDYKERVCLIQPAQHPWVRHETCVAYDKAKVVALSQLLSLKDQGLIELQTPITVELLQHIRDRAGDSVDLPMEMADILSQQGLVDF